MRRKKCHFGWIGEDKRIILKVKRSFENKNIGIEV
jgi:hypothetical protein